MPDTTPTPNDPGSTSLCAMPTNPEPTPNQTPNGSANDPEPQGEPRANQPERFGERDDEQGEPFAEPARTNGEQWRSVQEVAELEGLTERAIQKRCQRGFYVARLVEGDKSEVWEIDAGSIKARANATPNCSPNDAEPTTNNPEPFVEPMPNRSPNDEQSQVETQSVRPFDHHELNHVVELLRVQLDNARSEANREREQSEFLKAQLEDSNRNAAELRAALRKALEIAPRQLPESTPTTGAAPTKAATQTDPARALIARTGEVLGAKHDTTQGHAKQHKTRELRPLWKVILGIR